MHPEGMRLLVASRDQLDEEARRAQKVRQVVDIATNLIMQSSMTRRDAESLVAAVRERVLGLFPDGEEAYELIYAPRFRRLLDEFAPAPADRQGIVVPFPSSRG
jgi:hypothetical protein